LPFSDPYHRLADIYESIVAVESFVEGMTFAEFCAEEKTVAAVERKLSVLAKLRSAWARKDQGYARIFHVEMFVHRQLAAASV
jgi:hypothetical protein